MDDKKELEPKLIPISAIPKDVELKGILIEQGKCHTNSYTVAKRNSKVKIIEGYIITRDETNEDVALPHVWNKLNNVYFDVTSDFIFGQENVGAVAIYFEIAEYYVTDFVEGALFQFKDITKLFVVVSNISFSKKLYIIGNGFDLYHQIKSRYWDFREYVRKTNEKLFESVEKYFNPEALWSDFEQTLAYLDTDRIIDEASNYLMSYSDDNWRDSGHHDYQYEVQKRIDLITEELRKKFCEWIGGLQISTPQNLLSLNRKAAFLNFNYTSTLESIYKVSEHYIFYIHNKYIDPTSNLILGHGKRIEPNENIDHDADPRIIEGNKILDQYFMDTYKSTDKIIEGAKGFFEKLNETKDIYVLGHSLSDVDFPYFEEICKNIDLTQVKWHVSCHSQKDQLHHSTTMQKLGIPQNLVVYDQIDRLDSGKYAQLKFEL